ncbi:MAG: PPA1309 family protein [Nocardioidaceae bacterium]
MTDSGERPADPVLRAAVLELEAHAAEAGWDAPARLFALVGTEALVRDEPELATELGITAGGAGLTAIEQEQVPGEELEELLLGIAWPPSVDGCAVVLERVVLPPEAEEQVPDDPQEAAAFAAGHPNASEVRIVAAVTRLGGTHSAVRVRTQDDPPVDPPPGSSLGPPPLIEGSDLVPTLLELLASTLTGPDDPGLPD